jgi:hypothetical protein
VRELKFRAKRTKTEEGQSPWVYSSNLKVDYDKKKLTLGGIKCDCDTLGEWTGLVDQKKKDIYEGDIVRVMTVWSLPARYQYYRYDLIEFHQSEGRTGWSVCMFPEVMGNIYDEPNLLERLNTRLKELKDKEWKELMS